MNAALGEASNLADTVSLTVLSLQTVLLVSEVLVHLPGPAGPVGLGLELLFVLLKLLLIHLGQGFDGKLDIGDECVTSAPAEVLTNNNTHHPQTLRVGRHGVCWHYPSSLTQLVGDSKLIKLVAILRVETESDQRKAFAAGLGHEEEAKFLDREGKVVRCAGQVGHDGTVALLAEADELVVLAQNLGSTTGEVQSEGSLVCSKVVNVENELLGEVLRIAPDAPADTRVDLDSVSGREKVRFKWALERHTKPYL